MPPLILVQLHLHLWERSIFVRLGPSEYQERCGTLMTLCGTQRGVSGSTYCDRGGPWFTTSLSQEVSNDIKVRMCLTFHTILENIGVDQLEIFIY